MKGVTALEASRVFGFDAKYESQIRQCSATLILQFCPGNYYLQARLNLKFVILALDLLRPTSSGFFGLSNLEMAGGRRWSGLRAISHHTISLWL